MKKIFYILFIGFNIASVVFTACEKDDSETQAQNNNNHNNTPDTIPPVIIINGSDTVITPLNSSYADPGATATDNVDGTVVVISNISSTNPNVNLAGIYTINYSATDSAGNQSTATRTVIVTYTMWQLNHNYNVTDICLSDTIFNQYYVSSVFADTNYVYRTYFGNIMNFFSGLAYMEPLGENITIPKQKPDGIFSPYEIEGAGSISENTGVITLDIYYSFKDTTNIIPIQNRHAVFVSF